MSTVVEGGETLAAHDSHDSMSYLTALANTVKERDAQLREQQVRAQQRLNEVRPLLTTAPTVSSYARTPSLSPPQSPSSAHFCSFSFTLILPLIFSPPIASSART